MKNVKINNIDRLNELREAVPGKWIKVYKDGFDALGNKTSVHFFKHASGKVFDVKTKNYWSVL